KRINESNNHPIQTKNLQPADASYLRREPPNNLDQRSILKEAALVLKQVERTKCKAEPVEESKVVTPSLKYKQSKVIATANKFNSLPTRRKNKSGKLLARSK
ncbi:uncharacterized protein LOC129616779, partial [Condylostylus longicornis]|uniref:uncharacterized protein LOC129616779 n=1 Tax=Condylostylus longicornis TaxID=2530218 RepID=UPI00244DAA0E